MQLWFSSGRDVGGEHFTHQQFHQRGWRVYTMYNSHKSLADEKISWTAVVRWWYTIRGHFGQVEIWMWNVVQSSVTWMLEFQLLPGVQPLWTLLLQASKFYRTVTMPALRGTKWNVLDTSHSSSSICNKAQRLPGIKYWRFLKLKNTVLLETRRVVSWLLYSHPIWRSCSCLRPGCTKAV